MKELLYTAVKILTIATLILGLYDRFANTNDAQKSIPIIIISADKDEKESVSPIPKNTDDFVLSPTSHVEDNNIKLESPLPQTPPDDNITSQQYNIKPENDPVFQPGEAQYSRSPSSNKLPNTQETYFSRGPAQ